MNKYFNRYIHDTENLAVACETGAADLRREAADALTTGDQARHDRKTRAAVFVEQFAHDVRDGSADLDHAQVVAHAANLSGILMDVRMPDPTPDAFRPADLVAAETDYALGRKADLESAAAAGLLSRVADEGQAAFYTLRGYEPDGYDPISQTTNLRDRVADPNPHSLPAPAPANAADQTQARAVARDGDEDCA